MSTPRCTICDCERIPLDRENTKFGACTNIECRDPLYDYRGENPYKSVPKPAEGVAAPLEPTPLTLQEFAKSYIEKLNATAPKGTQYFIGQNDLNFAEAYAAAVSKNLQQELARATARADKAEQAIVEFCSRAIAEKL